MPITQKQRKDRMNYLGSSDVASILGVSRWGNAYDIWMEKTGKLSEEDEKDYQSAGNFFEDGVLKWAEGELGPIKTQENGEALFFRAVALPIASHPDGEVILDGNPVEGKTAGLFGPLVEHWGEAGTDELDDRIIVQCQVHLLCMSKELCFVPAFVGGRGFVMYKVDRDDELMEIICDKSAEFWYEHVEKDIPPPDVMPSPQMIKRLKREPDKIVEIPAELVTHWLNAKEMLKGAEATKEAAQTEMLNALGDGEAGQWGTGEMITFLEQTRNGIDLKRLRVEKPDIASEYLKQSTSRVARLKKPKKAKY